MLLDKFEKIIQAKEQRSSNEKSIHKRLFVIEETAGFGENLQFLVERKLYYSIESLNSFAIIGKSVLSTSTTYDAESNADYVVVALSTEDEELADEVANFLKAHYDVIEF